MIKQFCQIGLLFLLSIGLVEAKMLRIGYEKNNDIGLVKAIDYKIGFENNQMNGVIQIKDNQTPNDNPGQPKATEHIKNKTRTRSQYKAQNKNTKKDKRGSTA